MKENIYLYFTSDLHSHFVNWPKIMHYLKQKEKFHLENNETYFLLDNGDHLDRFHPISEAFLGKANVEMLNVGGYKAATIGNNEGITLPSESFYHLYDEARFEVVCANLSPISSPKPKWLKPYTILTSASGLKIGLIGLTAPFNAFYNKINWQADDPYQKLDELIPELKEKSDIIVFLSHLGINEDEIIAERYDAIDVIIGGHTHHLFKQGEQVANTLLGATGKHGYYLGEIHIEWDHQNHCLTKKQAFAVELANEDEDNETIQLIDHYQKEAEMLLNEKIQIIDQDYEVDWFRETELITLLTDTLLEWTGADCAMLNAGILLDGLKNGIITRGDIHRICPHPINPVIVSVSGENMLEMIRMVQTKHFMEYKLKGFGFRGEKLGKMIFSNIKVETTRNKDMNEHVHSVMINGEPLNMEKEYRLATADMFTFGKLLPAVSGSKIKEYFMPEFLRDLLLEAVIKMGDKK